MTQDELLSLMTATIFAADPRSRTGDYVEAIRHAIAQADMVMRAVNARNDVSIPYYRGLKP